VLACVHGRALFFFRCHPPFEELYPSDSILEKKRNQKLRVAYCGNLFRPLLCAVTPLMRRPARL
jgi:hypothetical protein